MAVLLAQGQYRRDPILRADGNERVNWV